jgi:F420-0:gamma-glutamyl ligase
MQSQSLSGKTTLKDGLMYMNPYTEILKELQQIEQHSIPDLQDCVRSHVSSLIKDQVDWFEEYDPDPEDEEIAEAEHGKREAELLILQITEKVLGEEHKQVIKDISQRTLKEPREREEL